jgi:tetratricopeptide (TPR) repeat protein
MEFKSGPIKLSVGPPPRDPQADRAALEAIQSKLTAGDIEAAVTLAEKALAGGLEHPLTFNLAAESLESEDRYGEALNLLQRGYRLFPADLGIRQALALCLFRLQRFEEAIPHFDAMIAAQPGFAQAHAARGASLEQLGRIEEAEAAFRRAHELAPDNLLAIAGLGATASAAGRHAEARAFAEQVLTVEPGYPDSVVVLGRADLAEGHYDAGEARLRALIADPRASDAQCKLAEGLIADIEEARNRKFDA